MQGSGLSRAAAEFAGTITHSGSHQDYGGCVMVGNNLARDIAGANRLGMRSVWINWGDNYPKTPACREEIPEFEIRLPHEVLDILDRIERGMPPA